MRRPSEKADQKGKDQPPLEDLPREKDGKGRDELNVESLTDDDEDQGGSHLLKPKPCKKIKLSVDTQKELNQLEAELQKANPDKKYIKKAMDTTFLQHRSWIQAECPSVNEILMKYPLFKKSKYVSVDVHQGN